MGGGVGQNRPQVLAADHHDVGVEVDQTLGGGGAGEVGDQAVLVGGDHRDLLGQVHHRGIHALGDKGDINRPCGEWLSVEEIVSAVENIYKKGASYATSV